MPRATSRLGCAIFAVLVLAACAEDRPTPSEWAQAWEAERARIPSPSELLDARGERCDELVGELRAVKDRLEPAPTESLDAAVDAWVDHAETIAFDCPNDPDRLAQLYSGLDVLTAEVDAGLEAAS